MTATAEKTSGYAWYALALLMFVYILNFLDRQIIYILLPNIKAEMAFTDLQLSLLSGTPFVLFYTVLGIPFGRLSDKRSRIKMIAIGLTVWSLFSGLTGFANGFWSIFTCRLMVGVGEATLGPAAISLLADYFPPARRATVTSIYSMGIAIGAGCAALLGGYLSKFGWREAFFLVGFPGVIVAVIVFLLRDPGRTSVDDNAGLTAEGVDIEKGWKKLLGNRAFILLCLGYALFGLATNNISIWGAVFYSRVIGIPIPDYGYWAGILTLAAGIPATLFGGMLADKFRRRSPGGRMYYGAVLSLISIPCWFILLFSSSPYLVFPVAFVILFAALGWLGAAAADATEISGANLRGFAVAIYFFTVNIAAYLIGANLIGYLSDKLGSTANPQMLRYALLLCPICCLLGAICLLLGGRSLSRQPS
jgi:MFS family permease